MREMWSSGLMRYSQLCVCRGRIHLIPVEDKHYTATVLWGTGVYLRVRWFAEEIPPGVQEGKVCTIIGNIQTYNLGREVALANAMHVPKYGAQLGKEVRELVARYLLTPKTYLSDEDLKALTKRVHASHEKKRELAKALYKKSR